MTFGIFKWSVAIASLIGVVLNVRKRRECFYIWFVTNAAWTTVDVIHEVWSQAALQAVYCALSLWGIWEWKHGREDSERGRDDECVATVSNADGQSAGVHAGGSDGAHSETGGVQLV